MTEGGDRWRISLNNHTNERCGFLFSGPGRGKLFVEMSEDYSEGENNGKR